MVSDKISIILVSELREDLQMAGMIASVGAVSGNSVSVLISMNALKYFLKGANDKAPVAGHMGEMLDRKKAPSFKTLFEQAAELGDARIHPCSMAMDVLGVEWRDLDTFLKEPMGLTKFLDDARGGQVWSF